MAGDIQAVLNSQTAGVSDIHAWGLMLPSSSRVSPVTYHSVVAVRYPDLCRDINDMWELGSFASGGLPDKPPGFQLVLWDTNARINGLVATDLETLVSEVIAYWIPQHQVLLQWLPYGGHGRLPWPNHCRTYPLKIPNCIGLPTRHDGAYGHGSGCSDHSIWDPRPSKRGNDLDLARIRCRQQENLAQISRWSLNSTPAWEVPPLQVPTNTRIRKPTR